MSVNVSQYKQLLHIAECLSSGLESLEVRQAAGELLLKLLDADYYASYIWNEADRKFAEPASINMNTENLKEYEQYYQFHDPITHRLQKQKRATCVSEVISQDDLIKTEFYNDFLRQDGLYWGINLYAYDGRENIGDIRIWRHKNKENFDQTSIQLLEMIQPCFTNFLRNTRLFNSKLDVEVSNKSEPIVEASWDAALVADKFGFTRREVEIVREMLRGKKDDVIAEELCIACSTLRTHIKHIYAKTAVHNRSSLCYKILSQLTGFI